LLGLHLRWLKPKQGLAVQPTHLGLQLLHWSHLQPRLWFPLPPPRLALSAAAKQVVP
jgi:hypothetical protein